MTLGVVILIVSLLVVIMVHEAGHFFTAKMFNFKATQFFVGFGPTLWSTRKGETEYGVKALPLGGFVKIVGMSPYEEIPPEDEARSYPNKPRWQRAIVLVAGSATHWIVAFLVLVIAGMAIGFPAITTTVGAISGVSASQTTPAEQAGFQVDDEVVSIEGQPVDSWDEVRTYIRSHPGEEATFTVLRDGEQLNLEATLGQGVANTQTGEVVEFVPAGEPAPPLEEGEELVGFLGVAPEEAIVPVSLPEAVVESAEQVAFITKMSVIGIGQVFSQVFNGDLWRALAGEGERAPGEGPIGVVGAGRIAGESVASGRYLAIVQLIVSFTIFVGLMNLLPLPPLDGGHLAVVAYEAVTKRRVDVRKLIPIAAAVISFFVMLFLAVLYLDLARPITLPF